MFAEMLSNANQAEGAGPESLTFANVYQTQIAFLWRSLTFLGVPRNDLEDVCQEVLTVVHRQLDTFDRRAPVRFWILGIARGVMANYFRTYRRKRSCLVPMEGELATPSALGPGHGDAVEAAELIRRFYDQLDGESQVLFLLSQIEQLPTEEVARELGRSISNVRMRVRVLRTALRTFAENETKHV